MNSKPKKNKILPTFANEDAEREFWSNHSFTEYLDSFSPVELDLTKLKPSTETISLRLPAYLLARIKELANAQDVPYQSLMKTYLSQMVHEKLGEYK